MSTKIMPLGINLRTGLPLFTPVDREEFSKNIFTAFDNVRTDTLAKITTMDPLDDFLDDPAQNGWNIIIHSQDIENPKDLRTVKLPIGEELKTLCEQRGKSDNLPLVYDCENTPKAWAQWIERNYEEPPPGKRRPPYFLLIIGGPEKIPFGFQARPHTMAAVGRVSFRSAGDYASYFRKIIANEKNGRLQKKEVLFFAPQHDGITRYSSRNMAKPIADAVKTGYDALEDKVTGFTCNEIIDENDTSRKAVGETFLDEMQKEPCLVYTAGHGLFSDRADTNIYNGSIYCPREGNVLRNLDDDTIHTGHICTEKPFLEGGVFFQFACFGYGTPHISTIDHWLDDSATRYRNPEMISALPQKLLAHPRGPIAYVGHMDAALLLGFYDESDNLQDASLSSKRLRPFTQAIDWLLKKNRTIGYSLFGMRNTLIRCNDDIANAMDDYKKNTNGFIQALKHQPDELPDKMLQLIDAKNFMIFGDPAGKLRFTA